MDAESVAVGCLVTLGVLPLLRWVRLMAVRLMLLLTVLGSTTLAMASWKATVRAAAP